jgi:Tol biopolymer transport system component
MTLDDRFSRTLSTWLAEEAEHRVPDHLAEVLVRTSATQQRPWWSSLERLLPMTATVHVGVSNRRPALLFAALVALLLGAVGLALVAGSFRQAPPLPGLASNGRIVVVDGSSIRTYAPDGTDPRTLATIGGVGTLPAISPDGTRIAVSKNTMPPTIHLVRLDDGSATVLTVPEADVIGDDRLSWSPDGRSLTFAGLAGDREEVFVAAVDGSSVTVPTEGLLEPGMGVWQPAFSPDGAWIAFVAVDARTSYNTLRVIRPDGADARVLADSATRTLPSVDAGDGGGPVWAPDPAVHRIAYLTFGGGGLETHVFDLDTETDHRVGPGFWPSWSPDGSRLATCCASVVETDDVLAGDPEPTTVFAQPGDGNCDDYPDWSGSAICSSVVWSPDGRWLLAGDIAQRDLLLAPADGSSPPVRIELANGHSVAGVQVPAAWQPVWP